LARLLGQRLQLGRLLRGATPAEGELAAVGTGDIFGGSDWLEEPVPMFRADHPFLFLIRDINTNSILFLGRLVNPENATSPANRVDS
jgi:serine protease inhibitor